MVAWWTRAQTWETFSRSIPWKVTLFFSSSFLVMRTPSGALMTLLTLNPKKFLISRAWIRKLLYLSSLNDVDDDREVGVCKNHSEFVSDGDTSDHVSDSAADGAEGGISLFLLKPHAELKSFLARFLSFLFSEFERTMSERLGDLAQGTRDGHDSSFDIYGNSIRDCQLLFSDDVLHDSCVVIIKLIFQYLLIFFLICPWIPILKTHLFSPFLPFCILII